MKTCIVIILSVAAVIAVAQRGGSKEVAFIALLGLAALTLVLQSQPKAKK